MSDKRQSRRTFISLGLAASGAGVLAGLGTSGCGDNAEPEAASSAAKNNADQSNKTALDSGIEKLPRGIDLEHAGQIGENESDRLLK